MGMWMGGGLAGWLDAMWGLVLFFPLGWQQTKDGTVEERETSVSVCRLMQRL